MGICFQQGGKLIGHAGDDLTIEFQLAALVQHPEEMGMVNAWRRRGGIGQANVAGRGRQKCRECQG